MGTILVVHDELNSLELSVFKKDDRSKPELRYFPLDQDVRVEVPIVLGFVDGGGNGVHGIDVRKAIGVSLEIGDDLAD